MATTNKVNNLVNQNFTDSEFIDKWLSEEFQKKLKRILKNKREKQPDTEHKERVHTPYIKFCMEERPIMKKKHPELSAKEITAKLGEYWNKLKHDDPKYLQKNYDYIPK